MSYLALLASPFDPQPVVAFTLNQYKMANVNVTKVRTLLVTFPSRTATLTTLAGCSSDDCSVKLRAQRYDSAKTCVSAPEEVGCTDARGCDGALTWAFDSHGSWEKRRQIRGEDPRDLPR